MKNVILTQRQTKSQSSNFPLSDDLPYSIKPTKSLLIQNRSSFSDYHNGT